MQPYSLDEAKSSDYSAGKVKLEMHYVRKQEKLSVMVRHVKDLVSSMWVAWWSIGLHA